MQAKTQQQPHFLFVDDEIAILNSLRRFTRQFDWNCEFVDSAKVAFELLAEKTFDVIVSDMRMPNITGTVLLERAREINPDTIRILLTGYSDTESLLGAVNQAKIFNYITKPWDDKMLSELLQTALDYREIVVHNNQLQKITRKQNTLLTEMNESLEDKVAARTQELNNALQKIDLHKAALEDNFSNIVAVLSNLIELKENHRRQHKRLVTDLCMEIADYLQMDISAREDLRIAAMLHDIGILGLSNNILETPVSQLSAKEHQEYKKHPIIAETILAGIS